MQADVMKNYIPLPLIPFVIKPLPLMPLVVA